MTKLRSLMGLLAAGSLLTAQAASAAAPCVTEPEVSGMLAFAMPAMLQDISQTCRPHLSSNGYLAVKGPALIARYSARKAVAWPVAKGAFLKLSGKQNPQMAQVIGNMPDSALQPFVEAMAGELVGGRFKPSHCGTFERLASLLDPLPAEYTTQLLGTLIGLVQRGSSMTKGSKSAALPFDMCPVG